MIPMNQQFWAQVKYFKPHEFDSKDRDGSGVGTHKFMDARVVLAIDEIREIRGKKINLNSAYRTSAHNKAVKGAPHSAHLNGLALDVDTIGWTERERIDLILYARQKGFTGIGIAKTFIHIDMKNRGHLASWIYVPGGQQNIPVGKECQYV